MAVSLARMSARRPWSSGQPVTRSIPAGIGHASGPFTPADKRRPGAYASAGRRQAAMRAWQVPRGRNGDAVAAEQNKLLVRRLVEDEVNQGNLDVLDEVADGEIALAARVDWPFRDSFPDFQMEIVDLVAEREQVAAHFRCSGTHLGEWMAIRPRADASGISMRSTSSG